MSKRRDRKEMAAMIGLLSENRLSLKAAAAKLNVTYTTLRKYASRGYPVVRDGVRTAIVLESVRTGGKIETSTQAIERFIYAINRK